MSYLNFPNLTTLNLISMTKHEQFFEIKAPKLIYLSIGSEMIQVLDVSSLENLQELICPFVDFIGSLENSIKVNIQSTSDKSL